MTIYFDLDGTLLDSRERLYQLFCDLTQQTLLSFDDYWELKRNMYDHKSILSQFFCFSPERIIIFQRDWMLNIEAPEYLKYDFFFPFVLPVFNRLRSDGYIINLLTSRQHKQNVINQLQDNKLISFFDKVLVTENKLSKTELLKTSTSVIERGDIICGDTGIDITTGKELGLITVAVLSGFRSQPFLKKYNPNFIIKDIGKIYEILP